MNALTQNQAYLAMYSFLAAHYQRSKADDIGALLGSMSMLQDGRPADPAVEDDWHAAINAALSGAVNTRLGLTK